MLADGDSGQTEFSLGGKRQWTVIGSGETFGARQKMQLRGLSGARGSVLVLVFDNGGGSARTAGDEDWKRYGARRDNGGGQKQQLILGSDGIG